MTDRLEHEAHFHDEFRAVHMGSKDPKYSAYKKWYRAGDAGRAWLDAQLARDLPGRRALDFACGDGHITIEMARLGADVVGIDISAASVAIARAAASEAGVDARFEVMDALATDFPDDHFDVVVCAGVIHHMDPVAAYRELARIVKPDGVVYALEGLAHNPLINLYRSRTPHLRSPDEQPLRRWEVEAARRSFAAPRFRFFSLLVLASAPFERTPLGPPLKAILGRLDRVALRVPGIRYQAWMVGMELRAPRTPKD